MPKSSNETLFVLIKSLNRSEKRHFRLYVKRNSLIARPLFLELFNFLDRQKEYLEEAILKNIPNLKKRQLANVKSHLYKQLMTSLRLLQGNIRIGQVLREQVDHAHILYSKRMYRPCLQLLDKAKKKALELEMRPLTLEILTFEKLIESQYITRSIENRAEDLAQTSEKLIEELKQENKFSSLSLQLYGLYLKMGCARNNEDIDKIESFYNTHVPTKEEKDLNFYERLYLYQSNVWLGTMTHNYQKNYTYAQKWVHLFGEYPHLIQFNIPLYLKGLHNLLSSQFLLLKYEEFMLTLQKLKTFNSDQVYQLDFNEQAVHQLFIYIHKINRHFFEASFSEATDWITELEEVLDKKTYNWDSHREMVFTTA